MNEHDPNSFDALFARLQELVNNETSGYDDETRVRMIFCGMQAAWCIKKGDLYQGGLHILGLGQLLGTRESMILKRLDIERRERGYLLGKSNALSDAEKVQIFRDWNARIEQLTARGYKKRLIFDRLRIPKSTYYRYRKIAESTPRK